MADILSQNEIEDLLSNDGKSSVVTKPRNIGFGGFGSVTMTMNDYGGCSVDFSVFLEEVPRSQNELAEMITNKYLESKGIDVKIDQILSKHYSAHLI